MVAEQRRISFEEFARTLDAVFDDVAERQQAVLVQRGGRLYRLAPATATERTTDGQRGSGWERVTDGGRCGAVSGGASVR